MCVVSNVYDHYWDRFPVFPQQPAQPYTFTPAPDLDKERAEFQKLIKEFREAVEAAKTVDRLTGQADCVDPEKAKLEERVAYLEKALKKTKRKKNRAVAKVKALGRP